MKLKPSPPVTLSIYLTREGFRLPAITEILAERFPLLSQKEILEIAIFGLTEAWQDD